MSKFRFLIRDGTEKNPLTNLVQLGIGPRERDEERKTEVKLESCKRKKARETLGVLGEYRKKELKQKIFATPGN